MFKIMKPKASTILGITLIAATGILVGRSLSDPPDRVMAGKNKIRFQLQWINQAQFAGFYVAHEKGYYREEGLDVELIPGAFAVNPIAKLVSNQADIGMATGDQVLQRSADGIGLRAIGTVFDCSVACFVSLDKSGISDAASLRGKRIAVFPSYDTDNILRVFLKANGIPEDAVKIVSASGNLAQLVNGDVDVYGAYLFNEPLDLRRKGFHVNVLYPEDKGIRFYSDTIITTPEYLAKNRDLVVKFIRASRRGWEYAQLHPDEAVDLMFQMNRAIAQDPQAIETQRGMCRTIVDIQKRSQRPVFEMDESRWRDMAQELISVGRLPSDFVPKIKEVCDFEVAKEAGR